MQAIYIIAIVILIISAIAKAVTHVYLDHVNGHNITFARSKGFAYLLPYDNDVKDQDKKIKFYCNMFQRTSLISLVIFLTIHLTRIF